MIPRKSVVFGSHTSIDSNSAVSDSTQKFWDKFPRYSRTPLNIFSPLGYLNLAKKIFIKWSSLQKYLKSNVCGLKSSNFARKWNHFWKPHYREIRTMRRLTMRGPPVNETEDLISKLEWNHLIGHKQVNKVKDRKWQKEEKRLLFISFSSIVVSTASLLYSKR